MVLAAALAAVACSDAPPAELVAERAVLQQELENLSAYLDVDLGRLLVEGDLLLVVREELVGELLDGALPVTGGLPGGHEVRLDGARVAFRTGLALVELRGRLTAADRPGTFADIVAYAALEVVGIVGEPAVLRARPRVLGLETRDVGVAGTSLPMERLVDEIAGRRLGEVEALLGVLELPISLERSIGLPAVDDGGVRIPALALQTSVEVEQVLVADRRLWVLVDLELGPEPPPPAGSDPAPEADR